MTTTKTKTKTRALLLSLSLTLPTSLIADPIVRPSPPKNPQTHPGARPRSPFAPSGKSGFFIPIFGALPGSDLPWLRNWIEHPHEEPAPEEPGDLPEGPLPPG
jgi:hypothetical protein